MDDFIYRALIAAIGVSIIAGSLGCFVIWKRLSYFSDSISHSALLGVALGLATGLGINFGLVIVGGLFALVASDASTTLGLVSKIFGFVSVTLAAVNIFGGFLVTQRMLVMYKKKPKAQKEKKDA